MGQLDGKVALITGAARGQGRTHAVRLARDGADIVAIDLVQDQEGLRYSQGTPEDLAETVRLVKAAGRRIISLAGDVRRQDDLDRAVAEAKREFDGVDILVSNAGVATQGLAHELSDEQWANVLDTNLVGAWHAAKAVIPSMIERRRGGVIVFVSSAVGLRGVPGQVHYGASKHGIQGLMGGLANELGPHGIRVNTVNPGAVNTPMALNEELLRTFVPDIDSPTVDDAAVAFSALTLLPVPWVEPEDVSNAVGVVGIRRRPVRDWGRNSRRCRATGEVLMAGQLMGGRRRAACE